MSKKIKLIIFDLDGVLINSKKNMQLSWNAVNLKYSLNIPFKKYFKLIGIPFEEILKKLNVNKKLFKKIKSTFKNASISNFKQIKLYNNTKKILDYLFDHNFKTYIVTSKDYYRSVRIIKNFNLKIDGISSPSKRIKGKPSPDQLLYVLKKNKIKAKNALFIGDTFFDFKAAKKAKIKFLFASYGYGKKLKSYIHNLKNISEIKNYI